MQLNLDGLKIEIEQYLEERGLAVFYGYSRVLESMPTVEWNCEQHPDYKEFVQAAQTAGVKLIVFHQRQFASEQVDDALEQLADCDLPREDSREIEHRLKEMRAYDSLTCAIELSFDHEGRVFVFELRTDWYRDLSDVLDEIQVMTAADDHDEPPIGGYFSRN
jgi:hypothetical protein